MLLKILHSIGLTNLSEAQVEAIALHNLASKLRHQLLVAEKRVKIDFVPFFDRYFRCELTVDELGAIERDLIGLKRVIVIADHVEKPQSTLAEAVQNNMGEGVEYLFLVSSSKAEEELDSFYLIFEAYAKIAAKELQVDKSALIKIKQLPYDWNNYPYILYQCMSESNPAELVTYAFRGNELGKGISAQYESVVGADAHTIASAITSGAPETILNQVNPKNATYEDGDMSLKSVHSITNHQNKAGEAA